MMMETSSVLGIAFGSAGDTTVFMCVDTMCRSEVREKIVELFLQHTRGRDARAQLVQDDFKNFRPHAV